MSDICIYVVDHTGSKQVEMEPYRLLRVGGGESSKNADSLSCEDADCDATGESISYKNFAYSELTGLYWIWKNTHHDITGLMHYRRFLASPNEERPLDEREIVEALREFDFLVPRPIELGYSVGEQYCYCHISSDLFLLDEIMREQPDRYRNAFLETLKSDTTIFCNIMIAKKELLDKYCEWLFDILGKCEKKVQLFSGRDAYQMRVFGFLSERLFLVWLIANDIKCGFYDIFMPGEGKVPYAPSVSNYDLDLMSGARGLSMDQAFDADFYLTRHDDVAKAHSKDSALQHYLDYGIAEGRVPSKAYSMDDYANVRPRLRSKLGEMSSSYFDALCKEIKRGNAVVPRNCILGVTKKGLIDYAPVYDWLYYTTNYDDVPNDYYRTEDALRHFIEVGMPEGRRGSKGFSLDAFKRTHPELVQRFGNDNKRYYLRYIFGRGRRDSVDWRYAE